MREHALNPRQRRRFIATTDSDHNYPIFPDLAKNMQLDVSGLKTICPP
jgi:putative transposase